MKNILLTGHKGLIGAPLKIRLEKEGYNVVRGIDLRAGENILDINKLNIPEKIDIVIHCAAACKINKTIKDPEWSHQNNLRGTYEVLEFCRRRNIKKFVYFSSSRVLSKEKNPYTTDKLYGEELCKAYHQCYGIDYLIIRPSTVYGPCWDKTERLVHLYITKALKHEDLEIYGDHNTKTLDFTHVDDFNDAVILAIKQKEWNKEYNISGGEEFKVHELAQFIIAQTESKSNIKILDPETAQPQKVALDLSEIKKIGYSPKIPLKQGIVECIDWYKDYMQENNLI